MKVFIITIEPFPNGMAATGRIKCYAKAIMKAGMECEVLIFHRTEVYGRKPNNVEGKGTFEGIPFRYIGGTPLRASNVFVRKLNDLLDRIRLLRYLSKSVKQGDALFTYFRQNPIERFLLPLAKKKGWKIYRELCEYPYATSKVYSETEEKCRKYMTTTFRQYSGAVCISQPLLELARLYHPQGKYVKIPILIDEKNWDFSAVKAKDFGAPYIFHSGALFQQKDGIVDVLNAFADALPSLPKGTRYYFTGKAEKSADKDLILQSIRDRGLQDCVVFLGFLSTEELMEYIKGAALFIINKNDNLQNRYCFATKLGEYLLSCNPVITTDVGEAMCYLQNGKNAYIVKHGERKQLSDAIVNGILHLSEGQQIGKEGAETAKDNFCYESQSERLKEFFV